MRMLKAPIWRGRGGNQSRVEYAGFSRWASSFFVWFVDGIFPARPPHLPGLGAPWVIHVRFWVLLWSVWGQRNPDSARQRAPRTHGLHSPAQFPPFKMSLLHEDDVMGVCPVLTACDYVILDIWLKTWCRWHFGASGSVTRFLWCRPWAQRPNTGHLSFCAFT